MKNTFFGLTILILCTSNTVILSCNIHVCLTWQAEKDGISFKCKVNKLSWKVMFYNPLNQELAHCLTPIPVPECFTTPNNTIRQSSITNTTIFIMKQHIQSSLNGQWKCTHGTNIDEATVNITVLKEEIYKKTETRSKCYEEFYAWTMLGFTMIVIASLLYQTLSTFSKRCRKIGCTFLNGITVCICIFKGRHLIFTGLICIVTGTPMIAGLFYMECKYKEYFIGVGIVIAVILLMFYHLLEKSKQQAESGTGNTQNHINRESDEEHTSFTDLTVT